jgi:hypothetical protein
VSAARLEFDGALYRAEAVRQAAAEFAGVARVTVRRGRHGLQVTLTPLAGRPGARVLADELANHVLAYTVAAYRR